MLYTFLEPRDINRRSLCVGKRFLHLYQLIFVVKDNQVDVVFSGVTDVRLLLARISVYDLLGFRSQFKHLANFSLKNKS